MGDERITWLPPAAPGGEAEPPRYAPPAAPDAPARPRFEQPADRPDRTGPSARAVWALVLAIAGLSLLLVSLGTLFVVTLPCSIAAWVLAVRARGDGPAGSSQATAALWLARVGVIAGVAAAVVLIALVASGFDFEQFRDDLERELEQRESRPSGGVRATVEGLLAALGR